MDSSRKPTGKRMGKNVRIHAPLWPELNTNYLLCFRYFFFFAEFVYAAVAGDDYIDDDDDDDD